MDVYKNVSEKLWDEAEVSLGLKEVRSVLCVWFHHIIICNTTSNLTLRKQKVILEGSLRHF